MTTTDFWVFPVLEKTVISYYIMYAYADGAI